LLERPDRLVLVGRQPELAELLHQVESAVRGNGGLTLIYGEAGVGKTRLVQELARNAQWRGVQTVWGRCYELDTPPAYQPLVEALRASLPALREAALEPLWRAQLSRLLPELMVGETLPPHLPPEEERRRLLEAIARGFLALTSAGPHLVLLEDAHWMDLTSLETLRYLLPRLADVPLRLVLTARGEELDDRQAGALAALEDTRLPRRLDLERLDVAETGELVQRALDLERPAPRFSARLHGETEGNPFYVLETLRALADEGLLWRDADGRWSTPWDGATEDYAELPLPAGVAQTIERRLDRLPVTLGEMLGLAAVIGRGVDFDLWFRASNRDEEELLAAGDELCARGLLLAAEPDYVFGHDQIRRVTYDRMAAPRRRLYHRQVAQALAHLSPDEPEALAHHWTQAEVWDQAADCHRQAGDRARAVYANADAVAHYTQALDALERLPGPTDPLRSFELLLAREAVYALLGERTAQAEDLTTLETLAEQLGDNQRRAEVALRQAAYGRLIGDYSAAIAAAQTAINLSQDEETQAAGYLDWGRALTFLGEYETSRTQLGQALSLAREKGVRQVEAYSLRSLGIASWYQGDYAGARAYYEQCLRIFHQIGDLRGESAVLNNLGMVSWSLDDNTGARDYYEQALHIKREIGDRKGESAVLNNLGNIPFSQSDYARARSYYEQSLHIKREIGDRKGEGLTVLNLGIVFTCLGDYAGARAYCKQALQICREIGDRQNEGLTLTSLSLLSHYLGDDETALRYNQQALLIAQELGDRANHRHTLTCRGHALAGLGRLDEAADAYRGALDIGREIKKDSRMPDSMAGLARVSLTRGELSQAQEHVGEILSHLETNPTLDSTDEPFLIYLTCYQVLHATQNPRAQEVLATAYNLLQEQAAKIPDEATRRLFLGNVAANREIVATYRELQGQRITVRLPCADAPLGRPLRDDEYATVTWTVDALGDKDIPRKTDRRRHRILRLLDEAQAQGAAPTHTHLAEALEVSRRTIERDVAALRQKHPRLPPTRGEI
jgi:predicted ATPase